MEKERPQTALEEAGDCPRCAGRTKERDEKEYRDLMNRLSRVEGQVRGIRRMVEENGTRNYCEIFTTKRYPRQMNVAVSNDLLQYLRDSGMWDF